MSGTPRPYPMPQRIPPRRNHTPLAAKLEALDTELWRSLDDLAVDAFERAVIEAHRKGRFGRPIDRCYPTVRQLWDALLLDPGPAALVSAYGLGALTGKGYQAIFSVALARVDDLYETGLKTVGAREGWPTR